MTDVYFTVVPKDIVEPVVVLVMAGEMDRDSAYLLGEAATAAFARGRDRLVLDLSGLRFCDSLGLSTLLDLRKHATARGGSLHLACARAEVLRVLHVTNLDRLFDLHPSLDGAVAAALATD